MRPIISQSQGFVQTVRPQHLTSIVTTQPVLQGANGQVLVDIYPIVIVVL